VQHATIVRALMPTGTILFFENTNRCIGFLMKQLMSDSQSYNSTANDQKNHYFSKLISCIFLWDKKYFWTSAAQIKKRSQAAAFGHQRNFSTGPQKNLKLSV
jgi:hypothetical protein